MVILKDFVTQAIEALKPSVEKYGANDQEAERDVKAIRKALFPDTRTGEDGTGVRARQDTKLSITYPQATGPSSCCSTFKESIRCLGTLSLIVTPPTRFP
jgi:hypothetical protein